jgi:sporulation protein YlmC with PRC-barrel domain
MIRATDLRGRAVVDIDAAEKLGNIDKVILDPDTRRVAGFVLSRGSSFLNKGSDVVLPAGAVHAVGPDAVTVRQATAIGTDVSAFDTLPRVSDLVRRKVVSETGRLLGHVADVLVDEADGRIIGYALTEPGAGTWEDLLGSGPKSRQPTLLLKAEAHLRAGRDLIVAPDDAVTSDWEAPAEAALNTAPRPGRWANVPAPATRTEWVRRDETEPV